MALNRARFVEEQVRNMFVHMQAYGNTLTKFYLLGFQKGLIHWTLSIRPEDAAALARLYADRKQLQQEMLMDKLSLVPLSEHAQ